MGPKAVGLVCLFNPRKQNTVNLTKRERVCPDVPGSIFFSYKPSCFVDFKKKQIWALYGSSPWYDEFIAMNLHINILYFFCILTSFMGLCPVVWPISWFVYPKPSAGFADVTITNISILNFSQMLCAIYCHVLLADSHCIFTFICSLIHLYWRGFWYECGLWNLDIFIVYLDKLSNVHMVKRALPNWT